MSSGFPEGTRDPFLKLARDWLYRNLVQQGGRRRFSDLEALLDLEWHARWGKRDIALDGIDVGHARGEVGISIRALARRWDWSPRKVRSFLISHEKAHDLDRRVVGRGRARRTIIRPHVSPSPLPSAGTLKPLRRADFRPPRAQRGHNGGDNNGEPWRAIPANTGTIECTPTLEMGTGEEDASQGGRCADAAEGEKKHGQSARPPSPIEQPRDRRVDNLCADCGRVPLPRLGVTCFWCQESQGGRQADRRNVELPAASWCAKEALNIRGFASTFDRLGQGAICPGCRGGKESEQEMCGTCTYLWSRRSREGAG